MDKHQQAIAEIESWIAGIKLSEYGCVFISDVDKPVLELAMDALREKQQRENQEALTWEQIVALEDGDVVWRSFNEHDNINGEWMIAGDVSPLRNCRIFASPLEWDFESYENDAKDSPSYIFNDEYNGTIYHQKPSV